MKVEVQIDSHFQEESGDDHSTCTVCACRKKSVTLWKNWIKKGRLRAKKGWGSII